MPKYGNTSASSLLKQAEAAAKKEQEYKDSVASYEFYRSNADPADFEAYANYLRSRITSAQKNDPSKALSLQRTMDEAYRRFNSQEISRATLAVNYGQIGNRDKYARIMGLYNNAVANGDDALAARLESNLASLSITIQNEEAAAAGRGGGGRGGGSSGFSTQKAKINELEAKIDRAYQTGQPLTIDGKDHMLNAADYALNVAQIIGLKHQLLSAQASDDDRYMDDLAKLEKSDDYRALIDSGIVKFDENGAPVATDAIKNLAVAFKKDSYGNTRRTFSAPELLDGKMQWGLEKTEKGGQQHFIADRQLNSTITDPALKGRVDYEVNKLKDASDKEVKGVGYYNDLISGNKLLVQTEGDNKGLRATQYFDKGLGRRLTQEETQKDLKNLVEAKPYQPGPLDGILDKTQEIIAPIEKFAPVEKFTDAVKQTVGSFDIKKELMNMTHPNLGSRSNFIKDFLFGNAESKRIKIQKQKEAEERARQEAARRLAEIQARIASQAAAQARQSQANAAAAAAARLRALQVQRTFNPQGRVFNPQPVTVNPQGGNFNPQSTLPGIALQGSGALNFKGPLVVR